MTSILNYYGEAHTPFLHARGRSATLHLLKLIDCLPGEKILEIGFGTGATLALLANEFKKTEFYGIELSGKMLNIASSRLQFCGLKKKVSLSVMNAPAYLPYETGYFDKIYIESVLAIQEGNNTEVMLNEVKRILKPGGLLVMNETIWLETTSSQKIKEINTICKQVFGIIQASEEYPYLTEWQNMLQRLNFEIVDLINLDSAAAETRSLRKRLLRSDVFTAIGKLKLKFNSRLRSESHKFRKQIQMLPMDQSPLMQGYLIKVVSGTTSAPVH